MTDIFMKEKFELLRRVVESDVEYDFGGADEALEMMQDIFAAKTRKDIDARRNDIDAILGAENEESGDDLETDVPVHGDA